MPDLASMQALIIDLDGVLWRGKALLPGVATFFALLRRRQLRFVLATNNATASPASIQQRLEQAGVEIVEDEVMTSAMAAAAYLADNVAAGSPVLVIGEQALRQALASRGFPLATSADGTMAVVVGMDRTLSWPQLAEACLAIRAGAAFIGTNPDVSFPTERGLVPGNGATLAALQAATDIAPAIIGKPEPHLYEQALQQMGVPAEHTLVLGDRLETDILGGQRIGAPTGLLLTGVTDRAQLESSDIQPDFLFADLAAVIDALTDPGI